MDSARPWQVPMSAPDLTEAEREAVAGVLDTPHLSMGPQVQAFEAAVAELAGVKHAIAVNSGTAGLHLCVRAAGIDGGDLVITTPFSFIASANVLLYERAIPVFVDVDPEFGNISASEVGAAAADLAAGGQRRRSRLPRRGAEAAGDLKAMLPVDVFGVPADYEALGPLAERASAALIVDACESLGSRRNGRAAGSMGDAGVYAFYPNKQITTGEGGMVLTDQDDWAGLVRALRNQGRAPGDTWLEHSHLGYNYRLDEMSAALGAVQMQRLPELLARRQQVADWYQQRLSELTTVDPPAIAPGTDQVGWFVYVIRLAAGQDRSGVAEALAKSGIPSRPYFRPIHLQPYYRDRFGFEPGDFPVAESLGQRSLALPFSGVMSEAQVDQVVAALRGAVGG